MTSSFDITWGNVISVIAALGSFIGLMECVSRYIAARALRNKRLDDIETLLNTRPDTQRVAELEKKMKALEAQLAAKPCAAHHDQLLRLDERTAAQTARIAQLDDRLYQHADRLARLDGHDH